MDQPDQLTKFAWKFVWDNFFILQNVFLEIWKIQEKTIKNVCQHRFSENFGKNFTVDSNYYLLFKFFSKFLLNRSQQTCFIFTFSSWMRRYWFYVKNDFRNFHQIFTFWDPLSQKKRFLRKCLSVYLSVCLSVCLSVGRVRHNSR